MYSSLGQFSKDLKLRDSVLTTCPVYTLKDKKEAPAWVSWIPVSLSSASFTDVNDSSIREYEMEFFVSTDWGGMFSWLASEESACSRQLLQSVGLVVRCHDFSTLLLPSSSHEHRKWKHCGDFVFGSEKLFFDIWCGVVSQNERTVQWHW